MIFRKRLSPDQRAMKWVDLLDEGESKSVVEEIRRYPKVVTESKIPLLHVAILANQVEVAEALLQHGANPNHTDRYGQHPILLAAEKPGPHKFLKLLIAQGANVNVSDRHGASPLMYAARSNQQSAVKLLIQAGADPNHRDYEGDTVLMYAVTSGNSALIETLIQGGANPALKNFDGLSAFDKCPEGPIKKLLAIQ